MTSVTATCACCGLVNDEHRPGCPYFDPTVVERAEEVAAGIPEDISHAYDRLVADRVPSDQAASMVVAMKQQHASGATARTLEQQVDHFLHLRASLRQKDR